MLQPRDDPGKRSAAAILRARREPLKRSETAQPVPETGRIAPRRGPIVVAYDGSPDARRAAEWSAGVAATPPAAAVHLVRALGLPAVPLDPGAITVNELLERHEASAAAELAAERDRLAARGLTVETYLRRWLAVETVLERAAEIGAGLVVAGQHGHGPERLLLGSVSAAIVRAALCPMVVVRGREVDSPPRRALLALDESEGARSAAAALAQWAPQARVLAVHVRAGGIAPDERALSAALASSGLDLARLERRTIDGPVTRSLLEVAASEGVDLIAAGRRGESDWRALVLGSVTDKLVQLAGCPVLVAH